METFTPDWSAFPSMDESTWYELIQKELKGKPLSELDWSISPGLTGRPVYHQPGRSFGGPLVAGRHSADWFITEWLVDEETAHRNRLALEALSGGAQALVFNPITPDEVGALTEGIWMDLARVFWRLSPACPADLLADELERLTPARLSDPSSGELLGGFCEPTEPADHIRMQHRFPAWQSVIAQTGPAEDAAQELTTLLHRVRAWMDHSPSSTELAGSVMVRMDVGTNYLVEIARIRAWHILWGHLMKSFGLDPSIPCRILATISPDPDLSWETTYIAATTRALSAVFGGVTHLAIRPPRVERPEFGHRIARNIQHLMKEEAYLHRVMDPLAGSFAIEDITLRLAETAWNQL